MTEKPRPGAGGIGLLVSGAVLVVVWAVLYGGGNPVDAYAYWTAGNRPDPYAPQACCDFLYAPPFLAAGWPLWRLPFEVFVGLLRGAELAALLFLAGPFAGLAIFLPPVATEINAANVNLLLMTCLVGGFRWPALWAVILLTKPTAGVGLLWFVVRGEYGRALVPIAVAAGAMVLTTLLQPQWTADYVSMVLSRDPDTGGPFPWPWWARLPLAVPIIVWAARTDRRWALAIGTILAMPQLYFLSPAMLVVLLRLRKAS